MRYHDFTLEFAPGPAGGLSVRVADSPARQGGFEAFEPPPVEEDLEIIARAAEARAEAERSGEERADFRDLERLSAAALQSLGARLFEHLFRGTVHRRFETSLSGLGPEDGLRIKIRLDLNQPVLVPLLSLPWELLFEGANGRSFGLDQRFSIVRFLPQRRVLDRRELPRPLRILLATAEPRSSRLLSLDDEVRRISQAVARPGEIELETLANTTLESLRQALAETEFHVLHFMGHGDFDPETGEGELHLEDGRRGTSKVQGQVLADVLRGRASLRLVFLNACHTARTAAPRPFGGVATALVQAGVPAVLAMQFPIADSAAVIFSEAVYRCLAAGDPIDAAVAEGRKAMYVRTPNLLAWGTPVLFSHVPDGRLFGRGDFFQTRKPTVLPFPSLGPLFHGRDEMLWLLYDRLAQAPPGRATAIAGKAVHGLGGVGKTRLAVEFAWRYAEDYSALLFVGAGSPIDLRRNLAALCAQEVLDLPEREEKEEEVREAAVVRWLGGNSRWLLIFDNVDSEDAAIAVDALVARLHGGYVLLTGRLARWGVEVEAIELDLLTEEASVAFLLTRTDGKRRPTREDESLAAKIAQELGYLPLALEQAGAYIAERRLTLSDYLEVWQSKRSAVLAWFDPRVSRYPESVAVTWQASVDRLSAPARRLLNRLAWFGPEPIPETLLMVPAPRVLVAWYHFIRRILLLPVLRDSAQDLSAAFVQLATYSLVSRAGENPTFNIHRLVQEVTRSSLPRGRQKGLQEALEWLSAAFAGEPQDVKTWPGLEPLAPHARTVVASADAAGIAWPTSLLMNQLTLLLSAKAIYSEAESLSRRALLLDERSFGCGHPTFVVRLINLAQLLQNANRLTEAEPILLKAIKILEVHLEGHHLLRATALHGMGHLLSVTNRPAEAEPLLRWALEIDEQTFGPVHPSVSRDLNTLARLLQATNRFEEAEPILRRALVIDERSCGLNHPDVATGLSSLAYLLSATNRHSEAEPMLRQALAIYERNFGPDHPAVATSLNDLAQVLQTMDRLSEAEPMIQRALAIHEQSLGPHHTEVAKDLNNLALLHAATSRFAEAEPLIRRSLAIDEKSFGPDHPDVAKSLNNLALLLEATDRLPEAEPILQRALTINEKSFGTDHPEVAVSLNNLAFLLMSMNRLAEAELLMVRAMTLFKRSLGENHPNVASALNNLAQLFHDTNRFTEAEALLRRALEIDERNFGAEHPDVAVSLHNLAKLLKDTNRMAEAEPLMRRSVVTLFGFKQRTGYEHPHWDAALSNYAELLEAMGNVDEVIRELAAGPDRK